MIEEYKQEARESQLHWLMFRDQLAELAVSVYRDRARDFDPAVSMKTALTKIRIRELRSSPLSP